MHNLRPRVVVVGAGIAGRNVVGGLARAARAGRVEVVVIDARPGWVDPTRLADHATGPDRPHPSVAAPPGETATRFIAGRVTHVDADARHVTYSDLGTGNTVEVAFDQLAVCLGGAAEDRNVPGVRDHAIAFRAAGDALAIHDSLDAGNRRFVVVGASPAGIGLAGTLADARPDVHVTLVDAKRGLVPVFPARLGERIADRLGEHGVTISTESLVTGIEAERVTLRDATTIQADTVIWAAGLRAAGVVETGIPGEHTTGGQLDVDPHLRVRGVEHVWACGDAAAVPELEYGGVCASTAAYAAAGGRRLGRNILAELDGDYPAAFRRRRPSDIVLVGPGDAVGTVDGRDLGGRHASTAGRVAHIALRAQVARPWFPSARSALQSRHRSVDTTWLGDRHVPISTAGHDAAPVQLIRKRRG